ncbi:hypothetical protein [Streptomyces sp. NPDC004658]|uniref:hypothetical protein n=1 Tax=Streptomyces sp. NPDC004658 TaxID=3154672 RepID=UPI0033B1F26B
MHASASVGLDEVRVLDERVFLGPVLEMGPLPARAVLDLAAADAAAGLSLAERMRARLRIAAGDEYLHGRVALAAHLTAHPPAAGTRRRGRGGVGGPGGRGHGAAAGRPPDTGRRPAGRLRPGAWQLCTGICRVMPVT